MWAGSAPESERLLAPAQYADLPWDGSAARTGARTTRLGVRCARSGARMLSGRVRGTGFWDRRAGDGREWRKRPEAEGRRSDHTAPGLEGAIGA